MDRVEQLISEFYKLKDEIEKAKKRYANELKSTLGNTIKEILSTSDKIETIGWTQYTPYFNDGDSCEFGVNELYYVNGEDVDETDWLNGSESEEDKKEVALFERCSDLIGSIAEDLMYEMFGDHCLVTIGKNGSIDVEEYDHD